jgi:hypothetical protein
MDSILLATGPLAEAARPNRTSVKKKVMVKTKHTQVLVQALVDVLMVPPLFL